MSFLGKIFKRKEKKIPSAVEKESKKLLKDKEMVVKKAGKEKVKEKSSRTRKAAKKEDNIAYQVLMNPIVSEKSTEIGQFNKYVFKVKPKASKSQIKEAVEGFYGVEVKKVNIIKIKPKKRIQARAVGFKSGFKKAVVTLAEGYTIETAEGV